MDQDGRVALHARNEQRIERKRALDTRAQRVMEVGRPEDARQHMTQLDQSGVPLRNVGYPRRFSLHGSVARFRGGVAAECLLPS
jgi:hypothetical protein